MSSTLQSDPVDVRSTFRDLRALVDADLETFLEARVRDAAGYDASVVDIWKEIEAFIRCMGAQVSTLTVAASAGVGRPLDAATARLGTVIELYAYGILVHDDLLDRDEVRFGRPAFHSAFAARLAGAGGGAADAPHFGQSMALLGGALMQGLAIEAALALPLPAAQLAALAHHLCAGYRRITESQVVDLAFEHRLPASEEWFAMAAQRASEHLATTVGAGAILAGAPKEQRAALERFARALGFAYDLRDDLRDAFGDDSRMRSRTGRDLARSKKPLVLCIAAERAPAPERERLLELLARVRRDPGTEPDASDVAEILALLARHGFAPALDALRARLASARVALDAAQLREPHHAFFIGLIDACAAAGDELAATR